MSIQPKYAEESNEEYLKRIRKPISVTQAWVQQLTFMQQSVLMSAIRGCDGIPKRHKSKLIMKWYRRCILLSAFDGRALTSPIEPGGGSFTGPIFELTPLHNAMPTDVFHNLVCDTMAKIADDFLDSRDELPLHFVTHTMHAFEIVGYKHPEETIRDYWSDVYERLAKAFHLWPETEAQMDARLGDNFDGWAARNDRSSSCSD